MDIFEPVDYSDDRQTTTVDIEKILSFFSPMCIPEPVENAFQKHFSFHHDDYVTESVFFFFLPPLSPAGLDVGHQGWHGVYRFTRMCVIGCTCQKGASAAWVIQEAGLGYKNDEKKDRLPALWQWGAQCVFGPFRPLGLALVRFQHIKRYFVYWIQKLWIRPVLCFFFFSLPPSGTLMVHGQLLVIVHICTLSFLAYSPCSNLSVG